MQTGIKFRCYPTREQERILLRWIGCQRHVYNSKVREDRYFRTFARKALSLTGQHGPIDQKYAHFIGEGAEWLREVPSVVLRNGAVLWKQAYARFFKGLAGRPAVHTRYGKQSVWLTNELFRFEGVTDDLSEVSARRLVIGTRKHPVGEIAFVAHRDYRIPASIHVAIEAGQWFVSFSNDEEGNPEVKPEETAEWLASFTRDELMRRTQGLDRGVVISAAASDGQDFHFSETHSRRLAYCNRQAKRWQRIAARRTKGGQNQRKAHQRVARYKQAQANIRREFAHQTSHALVADPRHLLFVFEALKVKNMTRSAVGTLAKPGKKVAQKTGLNRSILESAWGKTKQYTEYKARRARKLAVEVPPINSSRECGVCGHVHEDNRVSQSEFVCQACGHSENADRNAARVIQARGVDLVRSGNWKAKERIRCAITKSVGRDSPKPAPATEPTPTEFIVRREGHSALAQGTSKWEALATARRA